MPQTYNATLTAFLNFLAAYTHTILSLRSLYPPSTFLRTRFHNTPVYQSRHPDVCAWITDAVAAVQEELLKGTVARIAIVIYDLGQDYEGLSEGGRGSARVMERYMLDVSSFPTVPKGDRELEIHYTPEPGPAAAAAAAPPRSPRPHDKGKGKAKAKGLDQDVDVDISENFRAAFVTLTTRCSQLAPLPEGCTYNIAMELKDEAEIDPPIGRPHAWIATQPSLQKTGRKGTQQAYEDSSEESASARVEEGGDLGGVRTTPIRTVQAGVFRFEAWVEEAQAKLSLSQPSQDSNISSGP